MLPRCRGGVVLARGARKVGDALDHLDREDAQAGQVAARATPAGHSSLNLRRLFCLWEGIAGYIYIYIYIFFFFFHSYRNIATFTSKELRRQQHAACFPSVSQIKCINRLWGLFAFWKGKNVLIYMSFIRVRLNIFFIYLQNILFPPYRPFFPPTLVSFQSFCPNFYSIGNVSLLIIRCFS